jgi:small subunit ribosomal protein S4
MAGNLSSCRMCRQAGEKLFLKGARCRTTRCAMEKHPLTPGQHGRKPGTKKLSEYGKQLKEKQKVKLIYGMREKQFRRFFKTAFVRHGVTGENLLSDLERRLDNVVFRLKMALSRTQARQMIVHGHINVNGKRVKTPSYLVDVDDVISLNARVSNKKVFIENVVDKRMNIGIKVPEWVELQKDVRQGKILRLPIRSDITAPIEEHLIVELYSK